MSALNSKIGNWCLTQLKALGKQCLQLWHRVADWYQAQQEVIKRQSEVSHDRITIKRAVLSFMETWGLGSRNIFYTMGHLMWRPGHLICDYLNGHRQRYMQPFFMFFVLTLILVTWLLWRKSPRIGVGEWVVESGEYIEGYNFAEIVTAIFFILCQLQILSIIAMLLFHKLPFDHMSGWTMVIPKIILFAVLLIDFKQLFRRDWWPTVWRSFIIVLFV